MDHLMPRTQDHERSNGVKILSTMPHLTPEALEILKALGEVVEVDATNEAAAEAIADCDAAFVGLGVNFDAGLLSKAPKLRIIATATTGLDHIDSAHAEAAGIKILSLRGEDAFLDTITGTAELALGLMISLSRHIPRAHAHVVDEGGWDREAFRGQSLYGKTVGSVGMGRLGRILARAAEGLRMKVVFTDPNVAEGVYPHHERMDLDGLLATSDFVVINVHLKDDTRHMFSSDAFAKMKDSAYLINTARGGIVDEPALIEALEKGEIAGYGTDVLDGEVDFGTGAAGQHPLVALARRRDNILILPHIGGMTSDSRAATDIFMAKKLVHTLKSASASI